MDRYRLYVDLKMAIKLITDIGITLAGVNGLSVHNSSLVYPFISSFLAWSLLRFLSRGIMVVIAF